MGAASPHAACMAVAWLHGAPLRHLSCQHTCDDVNLLALVLFREQINRILEGGVVQHDGGHIPEQNSLLGEVCAHAAVCAIAASDSCSHKVRPHVETMNNALEARVHLVPHQGFRGWSQR
jgi:hypothetical protein